MNHTARIKRTKNQTTPWADHISNRLPREDILDMLDRRQTVSLHSHVVQADCKGSTYFLERRAVREMRQSNGHKVQRMLQNIHLKALHKITSSSRVAKNLGNLLRGSRHKIQEESNRDSMIFINKQAMNQHMICGSEPDQAL